MGVCASSGGMFNNYAIVQGVDHVVPVDMYLPGCPPRPEMLIDAILKLHAKIMDEPLGARRAAETEGQRTELVASSVRYGKLPAPVGTPEVNVRGAGSGPEVSRPDGPGPSRQPRSQLRRPAGREAARAPRPTPRRRPGGSSLRLRRTRCPGRPRRADRAGGRPTGVERTGMFGVHGSGDTSGFGLLVSEPYTPAPAERPYGGYFDEVADALLAAMAERSHPAAGALADHRRQRRDHLLRRTATT